MKIIESPYTWILGNTMSFLLPSYLIGIFFKWWSFSEIALATMIIIFVMQETIRIMIWAVLDLLNAHIIDTENIRASFANDLNNIVQELEDINEKLQDIEREIDNLV